MNQPVAFAPGLALGKVVHPDYAYVTILPSKGYRTHVMLQPPSGEPRPLYDDVDRTNNCPLAWAPKNDVVYHSHRNGIVAIDINTGEHHGLAHFDHGGSAHWLLQCDRRNGKLLTSVRFEAVDRPSQLVELSPPQSSQRLVYSAEFFTLDAWSEIGAAWTWEKTLLKRVDLRNGKASVALRGAGPEFAVRPDGQSIAVGQGSLTWVSLSGDHRTLQMGSQGDAPSWSPDGRLLAYLRDDSELWIWDHEQRKTKKVAWLTGKTIPRSQRHSGWASRAVN